MIRKDYYIYCPHCGEEIVVKKDELDVDIDSFEIECKHCKKEVHVEVEYKPIFITEKIERRYCMECGEEFGFIYKPLKEKDKVRKYSDIPDEQYCLCHKCETKLKFEDIKEGDFKFILRKRH